MPMINAFLKKVYVHDISLEAYFLEVGTCYKQIENSTFFQTWFRCVAKYLYGKFCSVIFKSTIFPKNRLARSFEILIYFSITPQLDWNAVKYVTSKHLK